MAHSHLKEEALKAPTLNRTVQTETAGGCGAWSLWYFDQSLSQTFREHHWGPCLFAEKAYVTFNFVSFQISLQIDSFDESCVTPSYTGGAVNLGGS